MMPPLRRCVPFFALCLAWSILLSDRLQAGLSAENVVVIVNADSHESRTLANHYVQQREIPSSNVIFLSGVPSGLKISLRDFKAKILRPLLAELDQRRAAAHVRVVAYSAGFPTSVDIGEHTRQLTDPEQKKYQKPTASLTGLTYFYQFVLGDSPRYLDWGSNLYARGPFARTFQNPFLDEARQLQFKEAESNFKEEKFAEAAKLFESLFRKQKTIPSLAIRAAEAHASNDDKNAAKEWLLEAIRAGWKSGTYLDQSESLRELISDGALKTIRDQLSDMPIEQQPPVAFSGKVGWLANGDQTIASDGIPYLLSCQLAVVDKRGSTLEQAITMVETAGDSDFQQPAGEFWFTSTKDIRTKTRRPGFEDARQWLGALGHQSELLQTSLPQREGTCAGLMLGTPTMNLDDRKWTFAPGAIAENLTSHSANFGTAAQSKITDLLHAGAVMSSGPVYEPYSIPFKFPTPMLYGYYASGVSAIEAFYLSVRSPYQLLIVGDPLAQPYARPPSDLVIASLAATAPRQVNIQRRAAAVPDQRGATASIDLFIEGTLVQQLKPLENVRMNLPNDLSGAFELRTVLVGDDATQPRRSHVDWIELKGETPIPTARRDGKSNGVIVACPGATSIKLAHHTETVGSIQGDQGVIQVDRSKLGDGPLRLRAVATFDERTIPGRTFVLKD